MEHRITCRTILRDIVVTAMLVVVVATGAVAQTLTDGDSHAKSSPPPVTAKSVPTRLLKACATYGAGFVNVPGSDICIKIGGYATTEGTTSQAR